MTFYGRSDWLAAPPKADAGNFDPQRIKGVCIHYCGGGTYEGVDSRQHFRNVQAFYLRGANSKENYADIAYNVGVDRNGDIWELRGWTKRGGANGGTDANASYPSIYLVLGDKDEVPRAMVEGVRKAISRYREIYPTALEIHPHRDFYNTACPGPALPYVLNGSFEPVVHVATPENPQPQLEDEDMKLELIRPYGYYDTYVLGGNRLPNAEGAQELVNLGFTKLEKGKPFNEAVVVIRDLPTFVSLTGFIPAEGIPNPSER